MTTDSIDDRRVTVTCRMKHAQQVRIGTLRRDPTVTCPCGERFTVSEFFIDEKLFQNDRQES